MSRHRNIRNLDLDDYYDYEDEDLDYMDQDEDELEVKISPEKQPKFQPNTKIKTVAVDTLQDQIGKTFELKSLKLGAEGEKGPSLTAQPTKLSLSSLSTSLGTHPTKTAATSLNLSSLKSLSLISSSPSTKLNLELLQPSKVDDIQNKDQKPPVVSISKPHLIPPSLQKQSEISYLPKNVPRPSSFGELVNSIYDSFVTTNDFNAFAVDNSKFKFDTPSPEDLVASKRAGTTVSGSSAVKRTNVPTTTIPKTKSASSLASSLDKISLSKPSSAKSSAENLSKRSTKPLVNLVIVGHVDSGKSTLMGHLLHLVGSISSKDANKMAHESQKAGKSSFKYAWAMDSTEEERNRGVTIDVAFDTFETSTKIFCILDSPGHKDFVPNMISGATKADYAVLVVDAVNGAFESGFSGGGQTKEHAILCRSLGISHFVVAINKMDAVKWSNARFCEVKDQLENFLSGCGCTSEFIPLSAFEGQNIIVKHPCNWYDGSSLLEALEKLNSPDRPVDKPFRLMINDVNGSSVSGKVEAGRVKPGDKIILMPTKYEGSIKSVLNLSVGGNTAEAGDTVLLGLSLDPEMINPSNVICEASRSVISCSDKITAKIMTFDCRVLISGMTTMFHLGSFNTQATLKLNETIDKTSGVSIKKNPRTLSKNSCAMCTILFENKICAEEFSESKEFGRFTLRQEGKTIAAGIITKI